MPEHAFHWLGGRGIQSTWPCSSTINTASQLHYPTQALTSHGGALSYSAARVFVAPTSLDERLSRLRHVALCRSR